MQLPQVFIQRFACISALGLTKDTPAQLFSQERTPRTAPFCAELPKNFASPKAHTLPSEEQIRAVLPNLPARKLNRTEYLLAITLTELIDDARALKKQFGSERIGIILGTSTAGMFETESYFQNGAVDSDYSDEELEVFTVARLAAQCLGICGPTYVISTACSSSAKAMAEAARLIQAGVIDAALTGGMDGASRFTAAGFQALGAMSEELTQPFQENRPGLNLGEGGAIFLLSRQKAQLELAGWGETSDAHHITAPDPQATQVKKAMRQALAMAHLTSVDYVNLHGTGTEQNDKMEALAVHDVLGQTIPCSSTKAITGHTLGGAGALEAAFCCLALLSNRCPKHFSDGPIDPTLAAINLNTSTSVTPILSAMTHSFAFGGNNAVLIIKKHPL